MSDQHPVPAALLELQSVFAHHLADVRFGDVDKAALDEACLRVEVAAEAAAAAEMALQVARGTLAEAHLALVKTGHRALSYARIYAENNPALQEQLRNIHVSPSAPAGDAFKVAEAAAKPRRSRKQVSEQMPALPLTDREDSEPPASTRESQAQPTAQA